MKDSILLYSGGLDSTTLLHLYKDSIKKAIIFNYGSKHNKIENEYAIKNCNALSIDYQLVSLDLHKLGFTSSLLDSDKQIPIGHFESEAMKSTVVPFRNGIMLSIAAGIAESLNCNRILIANHFGDHTIYPDCRETFIKSMTDTIKFGTYNNIELDAPFTKIDKRQVALIGKNLGINYDTTYSCYNGDAIHCGVCGTCNERKYALDGFDTTIYKH